MDSGISFLFRLGWTFDRQQQLNAFGDPALVAARVSAQHRGHYGLISGEPGLTSAHLAGRFHRDDGGGEATAAWPVVGDWVAVQATGEGGGVIQAVLPRTSQLERRRPGLHQAQLIAANVDVVFVVTASGRDLNPRRAERYLAAVWASGARPVLVINKADLSEDPTAALGTLAEEAAGVPCLLTSAATGAGVDRLRAELPPGCTGALLGSSGVGKSSLLNCLLGEGSRRQETGLVRLTDEKGRHTTTRRELLELPGAGLLIDTPGMRELGLWDAGAGIEQTFDDLGTLAERCHFRDCQHGGEPGCAVAAALEAGELAPDRLASFEKLRREQAHLDRQRDPRSQARTKERWKAIHKQHRARKRVDPKLRDD